jgi:RHS repeat-associated protein
MYIYVSNESLGSVEAFFDDILVEHKESKVTQVADYYPFGMQIKQTSTDVTNPLANKYLYQGKELQQETEIYDFHARGYDPVLGRTWQIDPMAEKYYSLSSYSWVANNPIILMDPTGMEIDWGQLEWKEKRIAKRALRKHNSSGTYKNLYKQLKKSDNRYVIKASHDENTTTGGSFEGNFSTTIEDPDGGEGVVLQNPATEDDFAPDEKGGVLTLNYSIVDGLNTKEQVSILGDFAVEEVVHAAQYDDLNQTTANGLPGTANTEFEAKAIVGQIQSESRKSLWTSTADKSANSFGMNAFRTGSAKGYQNALNTWHKNLPSSSAYKRRRITNATPTLLIRLINR